MTECTARTGPARCEFWTDGAHRCYLPRDHHEPDAANIQVPIAERVMHRCVCAAAWTCLTGSIDELIATVTGGPQ